MTNIYDTIHSTILSHCEHNHISIECHFKCYGDENSFWSERSFEFFPTTCITYEVDDCGLTQFVTDYIDIVWSNCESPCNTIAFYLDNIEELTPGCYEMTFGAVLFEKIM